MNIAMNDAQASIDGIIDLIGRYLDLVKTIVLFVKIVNAIIAM